MVDAGGFIYGKYAPERFVIHDIFRMFLECLFPSQHNALRYKWFLKKENIFRSTVLS